MNRTHKPDFSKLPEKKKQARHTFSNSVDKDLWKKFVQQIKRDKLKKCEFFDFCIRDYVERGEKKAS